MSEYTDTGSGTPVVLLHSSMSSKAQWYKLQSQLERQFRVIAIDLYGYGEAALPEQADGFTLELEVRRLQRLLGGLLSGVNFHLIGHSYGGASALRLAYELQPQLLSLALYEPVAFHLLPETGPAIEEIKQLAEQVNIALGNGQDRVATATFIDYWSGPGTYNSLEPARQQVFDRYINKVSLDFQAGISEPLGLKDYQQLSVPICLIHSPESPLPTRQIAELITEHLSNLEHHSVAGGHMAPLSHAHLVNPILEHFIWRADGVSGSTGA